MSGWRVQQQLPFGEPCNRIRIENGCIKASYRNDRIAHRSSFQAFWVKWGAGLMHVRVDGSATMIDSRILLWSV